MNGDEGSTVGMTVKDMVIEMYGDLKVIRPIVEDYQRANVPVRLGVLESDKLIRDTTSKTRVQFATVGSGALKTALAIVASIVGVWAALASGVIHA